MTDHDFAVVTFNVVPPNPRTFKYDVLGSLSLVNHRRYCERHGYDFVDTVQVDPSRPACWAKLPLVAEALRDHQWVLWADSDTLIFNPTIRLEEFVDPGYDLIVQNQERWWEIIELRNGNERFPLNSGVFLIKSSTWARQFLQDAYAQTRFVTGGEVWDGVGEQEAMNHLLRANPLDRQRIKYHPGVQTSPKLYRSGDFLVHFYGNHAQHLIPPEPVRDVLGRWGRAVERGWPLPDDRIRFHWCCIQNQSADSTIVRGGLAHFLYREEDLLENACDEGGNRDER